MTKKSSENPYHDPSLNRYLIWKGERAMKERNKKPETMSTKRATKPCTWFLVTAALVLAVGCQGSDSPGSPNGDVGEMSVALTQVPSDVNCLRLTVTGSSRTVLKTVPLASGASTLNIALTGLPLGKVTVLAEAFGEQCSALTAASVPVLLSDPTSASIVQGKVTQLALVLKRNGQLDVSVDFGNEPACSASGTACLAAAECCSGACSAGVCATPCTLVDLALNTVGSGFPSPVESSPGWGGGAKPWEILDGLTSYTDWQHGLAFTGGIPGYGGESCGDRYAVVDFGQPTKFRSARVWHYDGTNDVPDVYRMEYWDGSAWLPTGGTAVLRNDLNSSNHTDPNNPILGSIPQEFTFPEMTATKVRYMMNNCDMQINGGWLWEVEIFGCTR